MHVGQARVPVGRVVLELPAGMLDDDAGDFVGTAAREVLHIFTSLRILVRMFFLVFLSLFGSLLP